MKKIYLTLCAAFVLALGLLTESAEARRATILYGHGPEFQKMYDLPDSVTLDNGHTLQFGVGFEQFSLFYVPIWNYGERQYAVYDAADKTIYTLDDEDIDGFATEYGWDLPKDPKLSFWNRIGGKLILLLVIAAIGGYYWWKQNQDDTTEEPVPASTADTEE